MLDGSSCAFCENREAETGSDYCRQCNDMFKFDESAVEAVAKVFDSILTETDDIDASNTGC